MQVDVENLSLKDAKEYYKGWELHGFNLFASDRISLQRETPPDPETQWVEHKIIWILELLIFQRSIINS